MVPLRSLGFFGGQAVGISDRWIVDASSPDTAFWEIGSSPLRELVIAQERDRWKDQITD